MRKSEDISDRSLGVDVVNHDRDCVEDYHNVACVGKELQMSHSALITKLQRLLHTPETPSAGLSTHLHFHPAILQSHREEALVAVARDVGAWGGLESSNIKGREIPALHRSFSI